MGFDCYAQPDVWQFADLVSSFVQRLRHSYRSTHITNDKMCRVG